MMLRRSQLLRPPRFFLEFAAWSIFLFSAARAWFVIIETNQIDNPFLFADEWNVSRIITSQPFVDASLAGHNRVPCYIQNALWWMDYTWLGYKGILPTAVQIGGWLLGFIMFSVVLGSAGLSRTILALCLSLLLTFWFSLPNAEQYSFYRWRGVEASLIFLFLSITLYFVQNFRSYQKNSASIFSVLAFIAATVSSWIALYVHGGFPLLPVTLIILILSAADRKKYIALGAALLTLFIWHFLKIHYTSLNVQSGVGVEEITLGFLVVLSSLPYTLLKPVVGQQVALSFAAIIGLSALGILGALVVRLIKKRATTTDIIALFLLAYSVVIALSITRIRIRVYGWEYALSGRYTNYSIYVLLGIILYSVGAILHNRRSMLPSAIAFFGVSLVIVLGTLSLGKTIKETESIQAEKLQLESQMVPYTLKPWLFPPRPQFSMHSRTENGRKIRDTLLKHTANVFGSLPYQAYSAAERTPVSEKRLPGCFKRIQVLQKDFIQEGLLVEISLALEEPWSEVEGSVLFTTLSGATAGWAVRQRCTGCFWQDIIGHEHRLQEIQGYMIIEKPPFSARAVLVNKVGEAVCASDKIEFQPG